MTISPSDLSLPLHFLLAITAINVVVVLKLIVISDLALELFDEYLHLFYSLSCWQQVRLPICLWHFSKMEVTC